jgi:hypothetical protein
LMRQEIKEVIFVCNDRSNFHGTMVLQR